MSDKRLYELSAAARLDLLEAWNYLAEHASVEVADKVAADIESAIGRLIETPGLGHVRLDLTQRKVLFYRVHSFLLIYVPDKKPLRIVRLLHAARDVQNILDR